MKLLELKQKLIAAARRDVPSERVPYAFEKRIIALLQARPVFDPAAFWARALWRAAGACVVIAILLSAASLFAPQSSAPAPTHDLSQHFEETLLAAVDQDLDVSP